jgi:hypothetical protein
VDQPVADLAHHLRRVVVSHDPDAGGVDVANHTVLGEIDGLFHRGQDGVVLAQGFLDPT